MTVVINGYRTKLAPKGKLVSTSRVKVKNECGPTYLISLSHDNSIEADAWSGGQGDVSEQG